MSVRAHAARAQCRAGSIRSMPATLGLALLAASLVAATAAPAAAEEAPPGREAAKPAPGSAVDEDGATSDDELSVPFDETTDGVEVITVTARRRTERLEDTPVAVTALGQVTLDEAQIRELDQIQDLVPNLTWNTGFSGIQGSVSVRGVGKASEDIVFDPGVGIYVDGVLLSRDVGQLLPMLDVQQIEVLRGPQGTLFGKNNVGGAINMITIKPQDEYTASLKLGAGNYTSYRSRAMVNVPLVEEKLFARASWASEHNDGYMANVTTGQRSSDRALMASMLALRAQPTERLTVDVSGSWSRDHTASRGGKCIYVGRSIAAQFAEVLLPTVGGPAVFQRGEIEAACRFSEALPERKFTADNHLVADIESYGVWGTIEYAFDDIGPVEQPVAKSITAWREQDPRQRDDTDMTALSIIQRDTLGGAPTFFGGLTRPGWQRQITQELQLQNAWWEGRIHSTTGVYLFWDQALANQELVSLGGAFLDGQVLGGLLLGLTPTLQQTEIDNFDVAVYHQSTWDVMDWLSFTAGVRWTRETKRTGVVVYRFASPLPTGETMTPYVDAIDAREASFEEWTPTASVVFKTPVDWIEPAGLESLNAYFTYSRGFKGGGFSAVQGGTLDSLDEFRPEFLDSFEIGFKTRAWGSRIRAEVALFYGLYDDLQVTVTKAGSSVFQVERIVENAAEATTRGFEVELQTLPIDGLLLTGSVGFLDAFYDAYVNSANNEPRPLNLPGEPTFPPLPPTTIDRSGDRFSGVPKWQTNLTAQYQLDYPSRRAWLEGSVTPRIEWIYESDIQYAGREVPSLLQPDVHRINARLTWRFNEDRSEVALWGKNLTDAYYFRNSIAGTVSTYGFAVRYYEPPRTYGIEVQHRF